MRMPIAGESDRHNDLSNGPDSQSGLSFCIAPAFFSEVTELIAGSKLYLNGIRVNNERVA